MKRGLLSRPNLFRFGDLLFLISVGMITTLTMHFMHQLVSNFVIAMVVGMLAAMLVQMLMALCAAPLLGSIETMTPSMVVGMASPMAVCTLHMFGCQSNHTLALILGTVFGAGMFLFVQYYAVKVRRTLGGMCHER